MRKYTIHSNALTQNSYRPFSPQSPRTTTKGELHKSRNQHSASSFKINDAMISTLHQYMDKKNPIFKTYQFQNDKDLLSGLPISSKVFSLENIDLQLLEPKINKMMGIYQKKEDFRKNQLKDEIQRWQIAKYGHFGRNNKMEERTFSTAEIDYQNLLEEQDLEFEMPNSYKKVISRNKDILLSNSASTQKFSLEDAKEKIKKFSNLKNHTQSDFFHGKSPRTKKDSIGKSPISKIMKNECKLFNPNSRLQNIQQNNSKNSKYVLKLQQKMQNKINTPRSPASTKSKYLDFLNKLPKNNQKQILQFVPEKNTIIKAKKKKSPNLHKIGKKIQNKLIKSQTIFFNPSNNEVKIKATKDPPKEKLQILSKMEIRKIRRSLIGIPVTSRNKGNRTSVKFASFQNKEVKNRRNSKMPTKFKILQINTRSPSLSSISSSISLSPISPKAHFHMKNVENASPYPKCQRNVSPNRIQQSRRPTRQISDAPRLTFCTNLNFRDSILSNNPADRILTLKRLQMPVSSQYTRRQIHSHLTKHKLNEKQTPLSPENLQVELGFMEELLASPIHDKRKTLSYYDCFIHSHKNFKNSMFWKPTRELNPQTPDSFAISTNHQQQMDEFHNKLSNLKGWLSTNSHL